MQQFSITEKKNDLLELPSLLYEEADNKILNAVFRKLNKVLKEMVAKFIARPLATAALWVRIQTSFLNQNCAT